MTRVAASTHPSYRVLLDGVDVSNNCVEADNIEGWVALLLRDGTGKVITAYRNGSTVRAWTRHYGSVEILTPPPPPRPTNPFRGRNIKV